MRLIKLGQKDQDRRGAFRGDDPSVAPSPDHKEKDEEADAARWYVAKNELQQGECEYGLLASEDTGAEAAFGIDGFDECKADDAQDDRRANEATSAPCRYVGEILSFHEGVGIGFIGCTDTFEAFRRDISVDRAEIIGFEVGDLVTFELELDTELGTPKAARLEAATGDAPARGDAARAAPAGAAASGPALARGAGGAGGAGAKEEPEERRAAGEANQQIRRALAVEELRAAMTDGSRSALQRALDKARLAGVEPGLLRDAEAGLRKSLVAQRLRAIVKEEAVAPLRERCALALDAGFENPLLADAEALLERRWYAAAELSAACDDAEADEASLRIALTRARACGVQAEALKKAQGKLRQVTATRRVSTAVSGMDELALRSSLARAREHNVEHGIVEEAEGALKRIAAINSLAAAVCGSDENALEQALDRARGAGVQGDSLAEGREALARLKASRELSAASDAGDQQGLEAAIARAKVAGVSTSEVHVAESVAARMAARTQLEDAAACGDLVALRVAVAVAEAAGLAGSAIEAASAAVRQQQAATELRAAALEGDREFLRRALTQAVQAGLQDIVALDAALEVAKTLGISAKALEPAEATLARAVAAACIREAADAGDEQALSQVLAAARECGADATTVAAGQAHLRRLAARRGLVAAQDLVASLRATGTYDAEGERIWRDAVEEAANAGVEDALVMEARASLHRDSCARDLHAALADATPATMGQLQAALAAATDAGVDPDLLRIARIRSQRLGATVARHAQPAALGRAKAGSPSTAVLPGGSKRRASECGGPPSLEELRAQKRRAVAAEDFELAARLRAEELVLQGAEPPPA